MKFNILVPVLILALILLLLICTNTENLDSELAPNRSGNSPSYFPSNLNLDNFPKRIFQTWKSKIVIPENMRKWSDTWKQYHPDYLYELWDDEDNRNFIKDYYPWFLEKYDSYPKMINRADVVRYFYLYHYGGIYVDMDFECLKNFDKLLRDLNNNDIIIGKINNKESHLNSVPNALMISKPRQDFWIHVFYILLNTPENLGVEETTGPVIIKKAIDSYQGSTKIFIVEPHIFYPIDWSNSKHVAELRNPVVYSGETYDAHKAFPESYAVTYWTHSW